MIDIYHSRRGKHYLCKYWLEDKSIARANLNEYALKNKPKGVFYAQPTSSFTDNKGQVQNVILYDNSLVNITTNDDVRDLEAGNLVLYLGHIWFVANIQREMHLKESEFGGGSDFTTYIALKK